MTLNSFVTDESGAVTVDWVVLTAAIVGLGAAAAMGVSGGALALSGTVGTFLGEGAGVLEGGDSEPEYENDFHKGCEESGGTYTKVGASGNSCTYGA